MTRPSWLNCDHQGIGLSGCPTCDGREDPYDIRRHIREARDYIRELEDEARRTRALLDSVASDYEEMAKVPPDDEACAGRAAQIGIAFGFGAAMKQLSRTWRDDLRLFGPTGGEFTVGPCRASVEATLRRIREP